MRGHRDLKVVSVGAVVCALLALLVPVEAIRIVFALPLALLMPGYALTAAVFARGSIDRQRFLASTLGLSLAVLALGGLLLTYFPGGIRSLSWALLLLLVILNGCRTAALRRPRSGGEPSWLQPRLSQATGAATLAALALAVTAIALAQSSHPAPRAIGYTQLWMVPVAGSHGREARIGVTNEQQHRTAYDLRVRVGNHVVARPSFELEPGEHRVVRVRSAPSGQVKVPAVATLLLQKSPQVVYRRVAGWLSGQGSR